MVIICGPETSQISISPSTVCDKSIRIYDIQPDNPDRVDLSIDNVIVSAFMSGSAIRVNSEIWTVFLKSKDVDNNTAIITITISEDPCSSDTACPDKCVGQDLWSFVGIPSYDRDLLPTGCSCEKDEIVTPNSPGCRGVSTGTVVGIAIIGIAAAGILIYASRSR